MKKKLEFVTMSDSQGYDTFDAFLEKLPVKERDKFVARVIEIEMQGLQVAIKMNWIKKPDKNLYEIRCQFSNNIQRAVYFHIEDNQYVITYGFTKKTQKTPPNEIKKAKRLRRRYLGR